MPSEGSAGGPRSDTRPIIIKRKKAEAHGGHGGSWKVAYADFVTAMMAFFLLMWLLAMVPQEKREAISDYFREHRLLEGGSGLLDGQTPGAEPAAAKRPAPPGVEADAGVPEAGERIADVKDFETRFQATVHAKLGEMANQVAVERIEEGVRIELRYDEGRPIFENGRKELTPSGRQALAVIGQALAALPNRLAIEGHTDYRPLNREDGYDNWDLSTGRALAAMHHLLDRGVDPGLIDRVSGLGSAAPYAADLPGDPRNRRISILVMDPRPMP